MKRRNMLLDGDTQQDNVQHDKYLDGESAISHVIKSDNHKIAMQQEFNDTYSDFDTTDLVARFDNECSSHGYGEEWV